MSKPRLGWDIVDARRGKRYAEIGRAFEQETMAAILESMRERSVLDWYKISRPNSPDDHAGIDVRAGRGTGENAQECAFGVTISHASQRASRKKHPGIPQVLFPLNTKPATIERAVLNLLDGTHAEQNYRPERHGGNKRKKRNKRRSIR